MTILTVEQQQQLITRAVQNETFRAALQNDARAAIAEELQIALPEEATIHVLAPGADEICQVIPEYPEDWPRDLGVDALKQRLAERLGPVGEAQQTLIRGQLQLIAKAWHDSSFKQSLLADPKATVEREFGAGLPAGVSLKVLAEDSANRYLVLPPALNDLELSDEQLEQVAGGETFFIATALVLGLVTATVGGSMATGVLGAQSGW